MKIFASLMFLAIFQVGMTEEKKVVVIIGAGFAGIASAAKLIENGVIDIVILEAEDRIGGRIHSIEFGGENKKIDLGGQWVHGEKDNVIYEMTKDHADFGSSPFHEIDETFLVSNGADIDQKKCSRLSELCYDILENSHMEMRKYNLSIGDFVIEKYTRVLKTPEYEDIDEKLAQMMLENMHRETVAFYASPSWFDISARLNTDYDIAAGNQYITWKEKGYITAVDYITKKLPNPADHLDVESKIQLNKEVINIKYSQVPDEKTIVKCADGSIYEADHVIITVSLGVLKAQYQELFTPQLPDNKVKVIQNYAFGAVGKIFLEFKEAFWPTDNSFVSYTFLWRDEDKNEIQFTDKSWLLGIAAMHRVESFPHLLEAFVAGEKMREFEKISDEKLIFDVMWLLEKFLNKKLPQPSEMRRTNWLTNKNFLGAYSYIGMGSQKFNVGPKNLAEALKKSNGNSFIHFAGEATDYEFPGYAHGAVTSGYRAAEEILKALN